MCLCLDQNPKQSWHKECQAEKKTTHKHQYATVGHSQSHTHMVKSTGQLPYENWHSFRYQSAICLSLGIFTYIYTLTKTDDAFTESVYHLNGCILWFGICPVVKSVVDARKWTNSGWDSGYCRCRHIVWVCSCLCVCVWLHRCSLHDCMHSKNYFVK